MTGFAQDDTGVDVELGGGHSLRAKYLVGCDGGRSLIRKKAGIDFSGWDPSISYLIAEGEMTEEPPWGMSHGEKGINGLAKLDDGRMRVVLIEPHVVQGDEPTLDDLREALVAVYGKDFGVHNVTWLSRFTDMARQAASYRERRVLLAGDAAHVHGPTGGQGLNAGQPLLGRRMTRSRLGHRKRPTAPVHPAPRCPAGTAQSPRARRPRHRSMGGSGSTDRCSIRWRVGAPGARRGGCSHFRVDSARWIRRVGLRRHGPRPP